MIYITLIILSAIVVIGAIQLSRQAEIIEANSKLNTLLVGTILAFATSLPELATGITSIYIGESAMSISNVLGSNIFNILILALMNLFFYKKIVYSQIKSATNKTNYFVLGMYGLFLLSILASSSGAFYVGRIDITILLMIALYVISIRVLGDADASSHADTSIPKNSKALKQAVITFIIAAIIILFTSIQLAKVAEEIMIQSGLSASFVRAIFIGVSTSLLELVTCSTLVYSGYYNMAATGVLASNLFNFIILCIVDILDPEPLFKAFDGGIIALSAMGILFTILTIFAISDKTASRLKNVLIPIMMLLMYGAFIIVGSGV